MSGALIHYSIIRIELGAKALITTLVHPVYALIITVNEYTHMWIYCRKTVSSVTATNLSSHETTAFTSSMDEDALDDA